MLSFASFPGASFPGSSLPGIGAARLIARRALTTMTLGLALVACAEAPHTGRQQLILLPDAQADQMGVQAYRQIKAQKSVSGDQRYVGPVNEIGRRIAEVSGRTDMAWEFTVFEDPEPNAFALPGGKVGVNTGLFTVAENEAQLAAVMAHEIGHAIARHGAERASRQILVQVGQQVVGSQYPGAADVMAQAATLGLILPFSRSQETEADEIGLMLMARAGYDPRAAVDLWQNFEKAGGSRAPEFLSTHPAPGSRIALLNAMMPRALEEYERSPYRGG